jgi:hypothetical protein
MRLSYNSKHKLESLNRGATAAPDPEHALAERERRDPSGWPLASAFRYRAVRLRRARKLRLCSVCQLGRRRCNDSRRPRVIKSWKAYRHFQWAVES